MLTVPPSQNVSGTNFSIPREAPNVAAGGRQRVDKVRRKARYHHGDLREALIDATRRLVEQRGAENVTLPDACRIAGVTTAAPYRHFRGKQENLEEIAARGFEELNKRAMAEAVAKGEGTLDGIIAMGQTYVA